MRLVRAAMACHDLSIVLGTPFISGKDSLNNEFSFADASGQRQTIAIPPSLLISAIGQIDDVSRAVTMDLKSPGNVLYLIGDTKDELGGSHYALMNGMSVGQVPAVDSDVARQTFAAMHRAISAGIVRACHDLSEGGLAVAIAEMAFAGECGARIDLDAMSFAAGNDTAAARLFSESNTRFLCEVAADRAAEFEQVLSGVSLARFGEVQADDRLTISSGGQTLINASIQELKAAWQRAPGG